MDASDRTKQRRNRTLFADKIVQQTLFDKGYRVWIPREGGVNPGVGAMTYQPNYYGQQEGAVSTSAAEFNTLIASVPNKFPNPPTNVTAALVSGQVRVSFSSPAYTGSTPITSYTVTSNPDGISVTGTSSPVIVTGLTIGQTYTFTVTAWNTAGRSAPSAASNSVATATVPDAPTGVDGIGGNEEVTVSFTAPVSDGGSTILDYRVTGYVNDISFGAVVGGGSPVIFDGLTNGTAYTFTVAARNAVGYSTESAPSDPVTPKTAPYAPTDLCVIPTEGGALLYFTAPNDGGDDITNYQYSTDGGSGWSYAGTDTSPVTVVGLVVGTVYPVKLRAINSVDFGAASTVVSATALTTFSPAIISGMNVWLDGHAIEKVALTDGKVTAWNDSSEISNNFTASPTGIITYDLPSEINNRPALNFTTSPSTYLTKTANLSDSNNKITVFLVVRQTGSGGYNNELFFTRTGPNTFPYQYFDIFNNVSTDPLKFNILCLNAGNDNQLISGKNIVVPPTNAIISVVLDTTAFMYLNGAPTGISGATRGGTVYSSLNTTLGWALSGAGFLGNYGELICYSTALSTGDRQSVEGYLAWKWGMQGDLSGGHPYATPAGPPAGPPNPPTALIAEAGNTTASIYFTAGYDGGSSITNYSYKLDGGSEVIFSPVQTVSPVTIASLANGTTYSITLSAINAIGSSVYSQSVSVTPTPPPSGGFYADDSLGVTLSPNVEIAHSYDDPSNNPFSGGGNSYKFNATNTYLSVVSDDSWDLGTGDFTIEWFQYQTDSRPYPRIFAIGAVTPPVTVSIGCSIETSGPSGQIGTFYGWFSTPATSFGPLNPSPPATPYKNVWQHFAIVRRAGILRVYREGQQFGPDENNNINISSNLPLFFGVEDKATIDPGTYYGGLLTNIRIVKGLAVYTGNFTRPTSALTKIATANPYGGSNTVAIPDGYTKLLFVP